IIIFVEPPTGRYSAMNVVVQFTAAEESKALPILLRHSPGTVLADRVYVVDESVVGALRSEGVEFREIAPTLSVPTMEDLRIGERI
ncbi:MAG TPA: hypothetical protein VHU84_16250, partial [Lacipirellulaceae bacterium]|nr:hypothetical protein [Lacipirellulaceae bacterium]